MKTPQQLSLPHLTVVKSGSQDVQILFSICPEGIPKFWPSTRFKESRKLASNSNGHDNEEHHQHTEHNYCINLEFKRQIFLFVVATGNFEEFKKTLNTQ